MLSVDNAILKAYSQVQLKESTNNLSIPLNDYKSIIFDKRFTSFVDSLVNDSSVIDDQTVQYTIDTKRMMLFLSFADTLSPKKAKEYYDNIDKELLMKFVE